MKIYQCHLRRFFPAVGKLGIKLISFVFVTIFSFFLFSGSGWAATYTATTCSALDVTSAISKASSGDTVLVPAGGCTWTTTNNITINKQITLQGNGIDSTIITTSGTGYQDVVAISAANVTVKEFTFISTDGSLAYPIQATAAASSFRIARNKFTGTSGYAIDVRTAYGLIDNNSFTFTGGSSQPIVVRGPSDSWQTESTIGGADNVFMEDNVFTSTNRGYPVCSTNARCVFRYNTMGPTKIDMHGECTGNPGVRHYEIYNNEWLDYGGYYAAFDIRGGTGRIFDNVGTHTANVHLWFGLDEHAANHTYCAGYSPNCGCVAPWVAGVPMIHQIGVGKDPKVRASEPLYIWGNKKNGAYWPAAINTDVALCATVAQCGIDFKMSMVLTEGIDFFNSEAKPAAMAGYKPYGIYLNGRYYHPLQMTAPLQITAPLQMTAPPRNLRIN